jgi:hypothetical protein
MSPCNRPQQTHLGKPGWGQVRPKLLPRPKSREKWDHFAPKGSRDEAPRWRTFVSCSRAQGKGQEGKGRHH